MGDYALIIIIIIITIIIITIIIIIILIIIIKFKRQLDLKEQLPPVGDEAVVFVHVCKENQDRCEVLGPEPNTTQMGRKSAVWEVPFTN